MQERAVRIVLFPKGKKGWFRGFRLILIRGIQWSHLLSLFDDQEIQARERCGSQMRMCGDETPENHQGILLRDHSAWGAGGIYAALPQSSIHGIVLFGTGQKCPKNAPKMGPFFWD